MVIAGFNTYASIATAEETIGNSQTSTAGGRPATAGMPEIVEVPTTVLASAGSPTAQYIDANHSLGFAEIRKKIVRTAKSSRRN
jgi:hypothetical protein